MTAPSSHARTALRLFHDAAGLSRHPGDARHRGPVEPARLHHHRQVPSATRNSPTSSPSASAWRSRPPAPRPLPCGVPKTGFMIRSMVTATARNIGLLLRGEEPKAPGDVERRVPRRLRRLRGSFVAQPQIPPRNVNWSSSGKWTTAPRSASRNTSSTRSGGERARPSTRNSPSTSSVSS